MMRGEEAGGTVIRNRRRLWRPAAVLLLLAAAGVFTLTLAPGDERAAAGPERPLTPAPAPPDPSPEELARLRARGVPTPDLSGRIPFTDPGPPPRPVDKSRYPDPVPPGPALAPNADITHYDNPQFPLTFDYPSNWILHRDTPNSVAVVNFKPGTGGIPTDAVTIEINRLGPLAPGETLQSFLDQPVRRDPGVVSRTAVTLMGAPGVRTISRGDGEAVIYYGVAERVVFTILVRGFTSPNASGADIIVGTLAARATVAR